MSTLPSPLPDRGARYFRADLQVHTPVDKRWPSAEPRDPDARSHLALRYLEAAKARGVDLVGVTEHHDVSWIDTLRHAANRLSISLLPGFEVETSEGVHVLCLFEPNTKVVDLEEALALLGLGRARRHESKSTDIRSSLVLAEVIRKVQTVCGGICIAAHVTSGKGLLATLEGGARADAWKTPELLAAQVPQAVTNEGTQRILDNDDPSFRRERPLAFVLTSDARGPEEIGTQSVWIKMQRPSVEGLRQAFLDPESRIASEHPHSQRSAGELVSVSWDAGFLDGQSVGLSPELTCLIGGKGTGKSTIVESVRWAFDMDPPQESDAQRLREQVLKGGSKVTVTVKTAAPPALHRIERTSPHAPVVRDELGSVLADVAPRSLMTPLIFSQKQLHDTAQSVQGRLELVDVFADDRLVEVRTAERRQIAALRDNAQAILTEGRRIDDWEARLGELPGLEQWRKRFQEAGFEQRLAERRALDREQTRLAALDEALLSRLRSVERMATEVAPPTTRQVTDEWPNADLLSQAEALVISTTEDFARGIDRLRAELVTAREGLAAASSEWSARRAARQSDFDAALRELQKTMPDVDPERYLDVERRIEALLPLQEELRRARERVAEVRAQRDAALVDLQELRGRKYRLRAEAARELTAATAEDVRVKVNYQADRSRVLEALRRLKTGVRNAAIETMVADPSFSPADFARRVREGQLSGSFGLPNGQASLLERGLGEEELLTFEILELCDEATVELDVGPLGQRDYRPLDRLSPGQKSTAILLLTLQSGTEPLLIDQPEDDLDNRFVYDDVVQRLRGAKQRRQLVVATHNANIPVLGDAEQILVLDALPGNPPRGEVKAHGPIDDSGVRAASEQILEGGKQAFRKRREKYGW
ncbi:MAG: TrlF family AAA-like ATPase [Thermoleophilaceae bacterium]